MPSNLTHERMQELLREASVIREKARMNFGWVENRDPNKAYIWQRNASDAIAMSQAKGYEIVRSRTKADETTGFKQSDGSHVQGDLIRRCVAEMDADLRRLTNILKIQAQQKLHPFEANGLLLKLLLDPTSHTLRMLLNDGRRQATAHDLTTADRVMLDTRGKESYGTEHSRHRRYHDVIDLQLSRQSGRVYWPRTTECDECKTARIPSALRRHFP